VWSLGIVVVAEGAQSHTGFGDGGELMHIRALIAHRSAHTFLLAILPGRAWADIQRLNPALCGLGLNCCGNKLGTMVTPQIGRGTILGNQRGEDTNDTLCLCGLTIKIRSGVPSARASSTKS
jgi:hypothetical protein